MSGPLRADMLALARRVSEGERMNRGWHVCDSCDTMAKPCYRHSIGGIRLTLCPNCMRNALPPEEREIV